MVINKTDEKLRLSYVLKLSLIIMGVIGLISINVSAANVTSCCEKTISGLFCQNNPVEQCNTAFRTTPSACDSTSFCKPGVCYDSTNGDCTRNTPKIACDNANGTWSEVMPDSCSLGCCVLGDQAAFVSLVKCKRLSAMMGLITNYNKQIKDETSCVLSVMSQDKGACVFESEYEKTCKFTTRAECDTTKSDNSSNTKATFYAGKLCTASELGTICGKTTDTICLPGKDEVYFKDTCGNAANIYDSSKINDQNYWTNVKTKTESCNPNSDNANSKLCGNCNYLLGSFCRNSRDAGSSANYGNNICANLNCKNTQNGNSYKHGESWCVYNDKGTTGQGNTAVGARFYKHICINGEEVLEQCADFKQEECVQDTINTSLGTFSQAACRVNRWQDCVVQTNKQDCENADKRDCLWKAGITMGNKTNDGSCLPKDTPGIKFWEGDEAKNICAQGNAQCIVTFEKGLFSGEKCVDNCNCLSKDWAKQRNDICMALGDCGAKINWIGDTGYKKGYNVSILGGKK